MRKRTLFLGTFALGLAFTTSFAFRGHADDSSQQSAATSQDQQGTASSPEADIALNKENYAVWRDHIQPDLSELAWEDIPWRTTFKDGITAGDSAGKPVLLWAMNGHPLGCT